MAFKLHPTLYADCHHLGHIISSALLLHKNALIPWFIMVPDTDVNELYKLQPEQQKIIQHETNILSRFVEEHFTVDKLNIATIGNIVPQLHIHIIGRFIDDFCWPNPVWGRSEFTTYEDQQLVTIKHALINKGVLHTD